MGKTRTLILILAIAPLPIAVGHKVVPELGLVLLFIENVLYFPVSWLGNPLFEYSTDTGGYIPSLGGRVCASVFYFCIFLGLSIYAATQRKTKGGINTKAIKPGQEISCPNCGSSFPKIRKPSNLRQALWGGFSCESCGKEYDKLLNEVHS